MKFDSKNTVFNTPRPVDFAALSGKLEGDNYVIGRTREVNRLMVLWAAITYGAYAYGRTDEGVDEWEWVIPRERAVLTPDNYHRSKTTLYQYRKNDWTVRINGEGKFWHVVEECAIVPRPDDEEDDDFVSIPWLDYETRQAYIAANETGNAYCVSVENSAGHLVGGLFGLNFRDCVTVESMFFRESGASKAAMDALQREVFSKGVKYIDMQEYSDHLGTLGATKIDAPSYDRLRCSILYLPTQRILESVVRSSDLR